MLYQTEFERGRHEGRHSYSQACENVDSVRKQLDEELEGARNAREELRRQTTEVEEQQRLYLGQDTDLPKVRLERDSLKVKLSEIEGQLKAFQVDYDKDKDITSDTNFDDVIGMSSPSVGGTPNLSRQRSSSQIVLQVRKIAKHADRRRADQTTPLLAPLYRPLPPSSSRSFPSTRFALRADQNALLLTLRPSSNIRFARSCCRTSTGLGRTIGWRWRAT